jgi:RNA methyltransferase, TrmH family
VVEGRRAISAALDHGATLEELLVVGGAEPELVQRARGAGVAISYVEGVDLERALTTRTPQPVVAVAPWVAAPAVEVVARARDTGAPVVVLAGVSDPGNAGTIIRSAAATGAAGVVFTPGSVDPTNPKCVRASAGALFAIPVGGVGDPAELGLSTVGAVAGGDDPGGVDLSGPVALVLGSEAEGLPDGLALDVEVALPLDGGVESLNVAMAATVLLYEARRQRRDGQW